MLKTGRCVSAIVSLLTSSHYILLLVTQYIYSRCLCSNNMCIEPLSVELIIYILCNVSFCNLTALNIDVMLSKSEKPPVNVTWDEIFCYITGLEYNNSIFFYASVFCDLDFWNSSLRCTYENSCNSKEIMLPCEVLCSIYNSAMSDWNFI